MGVAENVEYLHWRRRMAFSDGSVPELWITTSLRAVLAR